MTTQLVKRLLAPEAHGPYQKGEQFTQSLRLDCLLFIKIIAARRLLQWNCASDFLEDGKFLEPVDLVRVFGEQSVNLRGISLFQTSIAFGTQ